jgi:hypothetical protein
MKKIKIKSHSNLRPFQELESAAFRLGFHFNEYVRLYNFRPIELETYTIISLSTL